MRNLARTLAYAFVLTLTCVAQEPEASPKAQSPQETFFSGNVVSVTADKLTVTRRTLTLSSVTRVFSLDSGTRIDGKLQPKARVTVRFEKTENGDRAVRVIVR